MNFFDYKATKVFFSEKHIHVELANGDKGALPISKFRLLSKATPEQLRQVKIINGYALSWEELGEDLSVAGFFENERVASTALKNEIPTRTDR